MALSSWHEKINIIPPKPGSTFNFNLYVQKWGNKVVTAFNLSESKTKHYSTSQKKRE